MALDGIISSSKRICLSLAVVMSSRRRYSATVDPIVYILFRRGTYCQLEVDSIP